MAKSIESENRVKSALLRNTAAIETCTATCIDGPMTCDELRDLKAALDDSLQTVCAVIEAQCEDPAPTAEDV